MWYKWKLERKKKNILIESDYFLLLLLLLQKKLFRSTLGKTKPALTENK